jgi:hypothetical protein
MNKRDFIIDKIHRHLKKYSISTDSSIEADIITSAISGNTAFQIIYTLTSKNPNVLQESMVLCGFTILNSQKLKSKSTVHGILYSYDDGIRYQWSDRETLIIDLSEFRQTIINKIL